MEKTIAFGGAEVRHVDRIALNLDCAGGGPSMV
jgi:hypothetical protein